MRRHRLVPRLLGETALSTTVARLAPAAFLAVGLAWLSQPVHAENFNVATDGQLRSAISNAGNGDTITFTANITLGSNLPVVKKDITFNGGNFTLSGDGQYRGLFVDKDKGTAAVTVAINDLTITNAKAQGGKGGDGDSGSGGGGGGGLGGAIFVGVGTSVTVSNVNLLNSLARGGDGGVSTSSGTSGGGGGFWPTGANGGDGGVFVSGGGGTGGGGDGSTSGNGTDGRFGGGGGGGGNLGGAGGFGGGGGGSNANAPYMAPGGFGGGSGGRLSEASRVLYSGGGGGGAGFGGALFVQEGATLTLAGTLNISGNTVESGSGGLGGYLSSGQRGGADGTGLFLQGNGSVVFAPGAGQTQTINDSIVDQRGLGGTGANAGSWSLIKNGAGTTILTGAVTNAYSGGTTVNSGVLQGNSGSLSGKILNNANVIFDQAVDGTYAGDMSGTGVLTKSGPGALTLSGTNTHSGGTVVNSSTLLFTSDANLGAMGKPITLNNGTIGVATGNGGQIIDRPITINNAGAIYVSQNVANPVTWSGVISGPGMLVMDGNGTLVLAGNNTYEWGTKVTNGTLQFTSDANLGAAGTGVTLAAGGFIGTTKDAVPALAINRPLTVLGSGGIIVGLNPLTWSGTISGDGQFTKAGAGVLTLSGTNTYSGGTSVGLGMLQVSSDANLGAAGKGVTLVNNGGLWATTTFTSERPFTLAAPGGFFQISDGETLTLTGVIDGPGNLSTVGTGTLVLAGTSNYSDTFNYGGTIRGNTTTLRGNIAFDTNAQNPNARSVTFDQAADGSFAGTITGIGSVSKTGTGKLTLSGDNTYSKGTTVSAGTLQGTTRSLPGNILNNAALIFDQAFDGTFAGDMTGTGTLTKNGIGKINLPGTSSVGGGTTINAGGLAINGHLTSNVTVNKGGTLYGSGNVKGDITNNGGTVKPGNSIGHLKVDGNFTFNGGTYEVEINAKGDSDRVSVTGTGHKVTINAGTFQVLPEAGTYVPNTTYTIISSESGGTVLFGDVAGGVGFLTPQLSYDSHHVYLSLVLAPNAFRSAGQTVNQQAVGGALDAIAASGNTGGLLTAMANLSTAQGPAALQAMSGQPYADFGTVNLQASQLFMNAVGRQMAVDRGAGLGAPKSVALAAACEVACDADSGTPPRLSAWLSGIGSTGSVLGDSNAAGLTYTLGGAAFGIDYRLDPRFLLGIAGGYVGGQQWVNGFAGNGYTDALSIALYGSFTQGAFYADALAGYANASNRMQRIVSIPGLQTGIANGNTNANQFLGQIETGYKFALGFLGNTSISPFGRLQIGSINQAAFTESGSSFFNLAVAQQTTTSVRTTFGADFGARFDLGGGTPLDLGLRLGWMHEFADTARPMTAAFAAAPGPQFTAFGATPQRDSAVIGFSAAAALNERTSLFVSYDGEIGGGTNNHQLRAGFRLTW